MFVYQWCLPEMVLQASNSAPSAPPFQSSRDSAGPIKYPNVYKPSEEATEAKTNKDFWSQQLGPEDKEKGRNQGFWGDALGGPAKEAPAVKKDSPYEEAAKESARWASFTDLTVFCIQKACDSWYLVSSPAGHETLYQLFQEGISAQESSCASR